MFCKTCSFALENLVLQDTLTYERFDSKGSYIKTVQSSITFFFGYCVDEV